MGPTDAQLSSWMRVDLRSATVRDGSGTPRTPILSGQPVEYLTLQLRLFADGRRGGSPYAHIMPAVASRLRAAEMRQVAQFYASLDAASAR